MNDRKRGQAVDQAYDVLYERIVSGHYGPGVRMSQADLADDLKLSRTPLREALNRLQANGLLVATNNRGMEVAPIRVEHTEQLYATRLLVEPPMVAALVPTLAPEVIRAMATALEQMNQSHQSIKAFQQAHHDFHDVLLSRYPESIRELIESTYVRISRHQQLYLSGSQTSDEFSLTDRYYLEAIVARNAVLARQWLEFHLIDAGLGLALDIDPYHVPQALMMAAQGIDIELVPRKGDRIRPIAIRWLSASAQRMRPIQTTNLVLEQNLGPTD